MLHQTDRHPANPNVVFSSIPNGMHQKLIHSRAIHIYELNSISFNKEKIDYSDNDQHYKHVLVIFNIPFSFFHSWTIQTIFCFDQCPTTCQICVFLCTCVCVCVEKVFVTVFFFGKNSKRNVRMPFVCHGTTIVQIKGRRNWNKH